MNNSTNESIVAIAAAAGLGSRLDVSVPKALMEPGGMSLVRRSILAMRDEDVGHVVVTILEDCLSVFRVALSGLGGITYTVGGTERQDSVRLGLDVLSERFGPETIMLIHDAARPLVPPQVVTTVLRMVAHGVEAAVPMVATRDSIRQVGDDRSRIVDRSTLRVVQTPQEAQLGLFHEVREHVTRHGLATTDDASAIEALGHRVMLVPRHHDALEVTEQLDLALAQGIPDGGNRV